LGTVLEAADSREAMQLIEEHPDLGLVVLDLNLPDRDGFSVLSEPFLINSPNENWANVKPAIAAPAMFACSIASDECSLLGGELVPERAGPKHRPNMASQGLPTGNSRRLVKRPWWS
jgi:hypothetical protein